MTERLEPSTAVKLSVVADELARGWADGESVDTNNGESSGGNLPSPGDGVTIVPQVQGLDGDLGLSSLATLWVVESSLAGEGDRAKLKQIISTFQIQGEKAKLTGIPAMKLMESEISTKSVSRVAAETSLL